MKDRESGWNIFSIFYKGVGVWNIKGGWNFIKVKWCGTGIMIWRGSTDLKHSSLTLYETLKRARSIFEVDGCRSSHDFQNLIYKGGEGSISTEGGVKSIKNLINVPHTLISV